MKRIGKNKALELVKGGAMLVDMRSPVAFRDRHIDGAVNLPLRNFINTIMKLDKKKQLVIYGATAEDSEITQAASYATLLGFANIFVTDYPTLRGEVSNIPKPKYPGQKRYG